MSNDRIARRFYLLYLLYFCGLGLFHPYVYIYLEQVGLSKSFIGLLAFLGPLMAMVFQFGLGALGDLWGSSHRVIQLAACSAGVVVTGMLLDWPAVWFLLVFPVFYGLHAAIDPLINAMVLTQERDVGDVGGFGGKRLWGSVGFIVGVIASGWFIDIWGLWLAFPVYTVVMLLVLIPAQGLSGVRRSGVSFSQFLTAVSRSLKSPTYRRLIFFFALWGIPFGGNFVAFGLYWEELGGSFFGLGIAWVLAAVLEVPLFWLSARFRDRINYRTLLVVSSLAAAVRWLAYPLLPELWMWYLVQPLHAVMFVGLSVGGVYLIDRLSDPVIRNTGQSLLAACVFGLGSAVGNLLAGVVYDAYGAPVFYGLLLILSLSAAALAAWGLSPDDQ